MTVRAFEPTKSGSNDVGSIVVLRDRKAISDVGDSYLALLDWDEFSKRVREARRARLLPLNIEIGAHSSGVRDWELSASP